MKKHLFGLTASLLLLGAFCARAGTLSYGPIPGTQSDANCGISNANGYTSAVDGGNASGTDRVVNGITLYSLAGSGQSATADNCTLNTLAGTLVNAGGAAGSIQADGTFREVLSDMTFNNGATDNSQQEIVLDPASLVAGTTYDLRVYICTSGGGNRQVNLAFVGDGQPAAETGFFDEDDARTSVGSFQDANQVYYVNYRFTWDGDSTPGITVTQKFGQAPFVLYALTNQPVAAAGPPPAAGGAGINTGLVTAESDQVGVTSDTFYSNESLNKNGRWISVKKYGRCWQPTGCPADWRPYWRGNFRHCDDCGYTWVCDASEEEWGWAVYHYGRWCRVPGIGCGWAWIPGTVWGGAWVSWRQGQTEECSCVGWAPLPPEARCRVGVGISTWVDREYDIGPDCYVFVNVRHFGSDSFERCGCVLERNRYVNIIEHTTNITNISYTNISVTNVNVTNVNVTNVNIYNGGPDLNWANQQIRKEGGKEISQIHINHVSAEDLKGGKGSNLEGNTLALLSPKVTAEKNPKFLPKIATTVPDNKIDHGWDQIKDPKIKSDLKNKIAEQSKGLTPATTKATLPPDVAQQLTKGHGLIGTPAPGQSILVPAVTKLPTTTGLPSGAPTGAPAGKQLALPTATATLAGSPIAGQSPIGGKGQHPGGKLTPVPGLSPAASIAGASPTPTVGAGGKGQRPGAKTLTTQTLGQGLPTATPGQSPSPSGQHPGQKGTKTLTTQTLGQGLLPGQSPSPGGQHPGQKEGKLDLEKAKIGDMKVEARPIPTATPAGKGQHPGKLNLPTTTGLATAAPTGTPTLRNVGKPLGTPGVTGLSTATPTPKHVKGTSGIIGPSMTGAQPTATPTPKPHTQSMTPQGFTRPPPTPAPTPKPHTQNMTSQGFTKPVATSTPSGPSKAEMLQQQNLQQQQLNQQKLQQQQLLQQQKQQQLQQQEVPQGQQIQGKKKGPPTPTPTPFIQ